MASPGIAYGIEYVPYVCAGAGAAADDEEPLRRRRLNENERCLPLTAGAVEGRDGASDGPVDPKLMSPPGMIAEPEKLPSSSSSSSRCLLLLRRLASFFIADRRALG